MVDRKNENICFCDDGDIMLFWAGVYRVHARGEIFLIKFYVHKETKKNCLKYEHD